MKILSMFIDVKEMRNLKKNENFIQKTVLNKLVMNLYINIFHLKKD